MKFIKSISLITCLLILLTGCVKGNVNIAFKDSTNANIEIKLFFPESLLNEYNTSIDELTDKLKENGLQDWTSEKSKESINGVTYLVLDLKAPESINKGLMSFLEYHEKEKSYQVKMDLNLINDIYNTSELKDIDNYSLSNLKTMGLEFNLNIEMPGTIKETNVGKIVNNQVQIDLIDLLTQDKITTISINSISTHKNSFPINLLIIAGLSIILYLIIRKSK